MSERGSRYQLCQMLKGKGHRFFPRCLTGEITAKDATKRLGMTNPCNNAECHCHLAARTPST